MGDETITMASRPRRRFYLLGEILLVLALAQIIGWALPVTRSIGGNIEARLFPLARTAMLLMAIGWLIGRSGLRWHDLGVRRPASWPKAIGLGVSGFIAILAVDMIIVRPTLRMIGLPPGGDASAFAPLRGNLGEYFYWAGPVAIFVAGFGEELSRRAYLVSRFAEVLGKRGSWRWVVASALSGAAFGLGHAYQGTGGIVSTGITGFLLALLYLLARRNIWPAVIAHALVDLFGFTMIYLGAAHLNG